MSDDRTYAGQVEDGVCVQAIVGTAAWAEANLGGKWHDSDHKIGMGWLWTEADGWQPPSAPDPDLDADVF